MRRAGYWECIWECIGSVLGVAVVWEHSRDVAGYWECIGDAGCIGDMGVYWEEDALARLALVSLSPHAAISRAHQSRTRRRGARSRYPLDLVMYSSAN